MDQKEGKSVVVFGSSGLVGSHLVRLLDGDSSIEKIYSVRRSPSETKSSKIVELISDASELELLKGEFKADHVFICLGTTIAKAGSKEKFKEIDHDLIVKSAQVSLMNGATKCLVVSAIGADPKSNIFYNKVKGETEFSLKQLKFKSLHIVRPSLILGQRNESRFMENVASVIMKVFKPIFFGSLAVYKAMEAEDIAKAMLAISKNDSTGDSIYFVPELIQNAKNIA